MFPKRNCRGLYSNWNILLTVVYKSEAGEFSRLQSNQKYNDIKHTRLENIPSGSKKSEYMQKFTLAGNIEQLTV